MKTHTANSDLPNESYALEMDGIMESEHRIFLDALKAALRLKQQHPHSNVKLRDASSVMLREIDTICQQEGVYPHAIVRGRTPPIVLPFSFIWATWSTILARLSITTINSTSRFGPTPLRSSLYPAITTRSSYRARRTIADRWSHFSAISAPSSRSSRPRLDRCTAPR